MRPALIMSLGLALVFLVPKPEAVYSLLALGGQQSLTQSWDIDVLSPPSGAIEPGSTFTKTHRAPSPELTVASLVA